MVTLGMGEAARDRLTGLGYEIAFKTYPMQHQVTPAEIDDIGAWLRDTLG